MRSIPPTRRCLTLARRRCGRGLRRRWPGGGLGTSRTRSRSRCAALGSYGLIREYTGHGIGTEMHMDPVVRNYGPPGQGPRLRAGMALAIEPMITRGGRHVTELDDGWTVDNQRRVAGRALRAHGGHHRRGAVGAHRARGGKGGNRPSRTCAAYSAAFRYLRGRRRARCRVTRGCAPRTRTGSGPRSCCASITRWGG